MGRRDVSEIRHFVSSCGIFKGALESVVNASPAAHHRRGERRGNSVRREGARSAVYSIRSPIHHSSLCLVVRINVSRGFTQAPTFVDGRTPDRVGRDLRLSSITVSELGRFDTHRAARGDVVRSSGFIQRGVERERTARGLLWPPALQNRRRCCVSRWKKGFTPAIARLRRKRRSKLMREDPPLGAR